MKDPSLPVTLKAEVNSLGLMVLFMKETSTTESATAQAAYPMTSPGNAITSASGRMAGSMAKAGRYGRVATCTRANGDLARWLARGTWYGKMESSTSTTQGAGRTIFHMAWAPEPGSHQLQEQTPETENP